MIDQDLHRLFQRASFNGPDGSVRLVVLAGEGEFVCARCDAIHIAPTMPVRCGCGSDRIETLTISNPPAQG